MKYNKINHSCHHHELILKDNEGPYTCYGCNELGFTTCYQCEECNFHLHEECAMPDTSIYPKFFDNQKFRFFETAPRGEARDCDACGRDILGFMYQSIDGNYDLHPCCANLNHTISTNIDQEEQINLKLRSSASSKCLKCEKKAISDKVKGWCYATSSGDCYHVACVKAMVLENWKNNYLNKGNNNNNNSLALKRIASSREVTRSNEGKSSFGKKALKVFKKAALILGAIMSAIFGEPITLFVLLAENLISN